MQPNSPDTLVFVDQFGTGPSAPSNPLSWYESNYVFDDSAGSGIPVYMIDSGVAQAHPVRRAEPSSLLVVTRALMIEATTNRISGIHYCFHRRSSTGVRASK